MNQPNQNTKENAADGHDNTKKPYEKPRVRFERVFETLAMACGKVTGNTCRGSRKAS